MHIEVGLIDSAKMVLSYGTSAVVFGYLAKQSINLIKDSGALPLLVKSIFTSLLVLIFFEVFPHHPVGVSEVHLILGSTLFLLFGAVPAAIGLAMGLLIQGLFFAQFDLPNYSVNVTTLLAPLFAMTLLANKIIAKNTAYKDLAYSQVLTLSLSYQSGIIAWVAFWALYGQGLSSENLASVASFSLAYILVVLVEPLIDLAVLAVAKKMYTLENSRMLNSRLYHTL